MKTTPRFIAGAQCPRCKALDSVRFYRQGELFFRDCVECDFKEETRFDPTTSHQTELDTRVNEPVVVATEQGQQVIKILGSTEKK